MYHLSGISCLIYPPLFLVCRLCIHFLYVFSHSQFINYLICSNNFLSISIFNSFYISTSNYFETSPPLQSPSSSTSIDFFFLFIFLVDMEIELFTFTGKIPHSYPVRKKFILGCPIRNHC